jgi:ADP-ribose pyrophosphatase YjhB (NUDIX family)
MAKSSKLIAAKRGRILLVRRRRDRLWMFPGGRRRDRVASELQTGTGIQIVHDVKDIIDGSFNIRE